MNARHALATVTLTTAGLALLSTPVPVTAAAFNDVVSVEFGVAAWRPVPAGPSTAAPPAEAPAAELAPSTAPDAVEETPAPDPEPSATPDDAVEEPGPEPAPDATPDSSEPAAQPADEPAVVPTPGPTASPAEEAPSATGPDVGGTDGAAPTDPAPPSDG